MFPPGRVTCHCMSVGWLPEHGDSCLLPTFAELLFDSCYYCELQEPGPQMPAVPQGAFMARKVHEREMLLAKIQPPEQDQDNLFYHQKYMELSPLKYNSKLMNSIWGLYNRYSVHNFKKNTDAAAAAAAAEASPLPGWLSRWGPHNSY